MKKIVKFALLAALCAGAASCVKPITEDAFSKDPVAPELYAHNDILMTANTMDEDVNFSWSAYRNLPEDLSYQLVATYNGTDAVIATTKDTWFKTSKTAFKSLIYTSFPNAPVNDTFSLTFRVVVANDGDLYESPAMTINVYALGDAVAPVVTLVQKELKLDPATPTAEVALITWEPARLVYGEEISYNVYLTTATEKTPSTKAEAASDYLLAEGISGTSYAMTVDALNEAVIAAGGAEAAAVPVTFRVKALCASLPEGITASSDPMTVTTYVATFPDVLYTPGSHQGWDPATAATLKQSTSVKGYYEGIIDLTTADGSDAQFKFSPNPAWQDDFGGQVTVGGKDGVYVSAEGTVGVPDNISVPSGVYVIMLNKKLNTLKMVSIKSLGMIGTAAGGWSEELPMEWNKETNVFTVTADIVPGEYKFRLNNDWDFSVDNTGGVNGGGANYQTDAEGKYKVSIDMGSHPYTVKFADTSFPDMLYVPGSHNGWNHAATTLKGDGAGHYEGYINVGGEWGFKFTPQADWNAGEWGFDKSSTPVTSEAGETTYSLTRSDAGNIMEGSEVTYARVKVDLPNLEVKVLPVKSVAICGSFTEWSVKDEFKMTYSADSDSWKIEGVTIPKGGQWKFRMNDDANWTANLGYGSLSDLVQDGDNIADTAPGVYTIELFIGATPYRATLTKTGDADAPALPETMFIIGDGVGGWDWEANGKDMVPVTDKAGMFWAIRYIEAGKGFKFCPVKAWNGDFTGLGNDSGYTVRDGNCYVAENGLYMIAIDYAGEKVVVEPAKVYGIGECFGGWDSSTAFTVNADGTVTSPAFSANGELRMHTASSAFADLSKDWWRMEFIVLDGKIAYRGAGGDQQRVPCTAGQKVTLDFNAGTGVIE